jgi:hypothetical protein
MKVSSMTIRLASLGLILEATVTPDMVTASRSILPMDETFTLKDSVYMVLGLVPKAKALG